MGDNRPGKTFWTAERVGKLTRLWSEGASAGTIGAEFGVTRNVVIGKVHRLGLPELFTKAPVSRRKPVRLKRFVNHGNRFDPTDDVQPSVPPMPNGSDIPTAQRCTLLQLTSGVCKWPFGEPQSPDFFFCGGDAVEGKPYCAGHCRVAYRGYWN
jgi:GcrA cell cycle regulator